MNHQVRAKLHRLLELVLDGKIHGLDVRTRAAGGDESLDAHAEVLEALDPGGVAAGVRYEGKGKVLVVELK